MRVSSRKLVDHKTLLTNISLLFLSSLAFGLALYFCLHTVNDLKAWKGSLEICFVYEVKHQRVFYFPFSFPENRQEQSLRKIISEDLLERNVTCYSQDFSQKRIVLEKVSDCRALTIFIMIIFGSFSLIILANLLWLLMVRKEKDIFLYYPFDLSDEEINFL